MAICLLPLGCTQKKEANHLQSFLSSLNKIKPLSEKKITDMAYKEGVLEEQCAYDHLLVGDVIQKLVSPLANSLLVNDQNILAQEIQGLDFSQLNPVKNNYFLASKWQPKGNQALSKYKDQFEKIESSQFRILQTNADRVADKVGVIEDIRLLAEFDVRGIDNKLKRQDIFQVSIDASQDKGQWKIKTAKVISGRTLASERPNHFSDKTASMGLNKVPTYLRTEAIRRGGYAISVTDFNNDGLKDLFVGLRDGAEMYEGLADGTYKRKNVGLEKEIYVKTAVFADYDNDGDQDVMINRFTPHHLWKKDTPQVDVVQYENVNGQFHLAKNQLPRMSGREPMPSAVADFDQDGFLDLYVGYPGLRDFSAVYNLAAKPGEVVQGLYINDRQGGFLDKTKNLDYGRKYAKNIFPHSSLAIDYDQDGDSDLLVIDDRGNLSPVYKNLGKSKMVQSAQNIGLGNNGFGMSVAHGDYNNDGLTDLAITNVYLNSMANIRNSCKNKYKRGFTDLNKGVRLFLAQKNGTYVETTKTAGLSNPGDATGGLIFLDYDNDGLQDLYVVNGLWSGTKNGQNLDDFFTVALRNRSLMYSIRPRDDMNFMKILSQSDRKVVRTDQNFVSIKTAERPSLGGFQRNKLYRNNGDGTFTDVAFFEGVDAIEDGYIVGRADFNKDGALDLVLRNADPGTSENSYSPIKVFLGERLKNQGVILSFSGTHSNKDAIGLFAKAHIGKTETVRHLVANSGSLQDERMIHFGLGKAKKIDRLIVHWPSGQKQVVKNLKSGYHHLTEPKMNKVSMSK